MPKTISLRLPSELDDRLERIAKDNDRSKSYLVRKAIAKFVQDYEDIDVSHRRVKDKDDKTMSSEEMKRWLEKDEDNDK